MRHALRDGTSVCHHDTAKWISWRTAVSFNRVTIAVGLRAKPYPSEAAIQPTATVFLTAPSDVPARIILTGTTDLHAHTIRAAQEAGPTITSGVARRPPTTSPHSRRANSVICRSISLALSSNWTAVIRNQVAVASSADASSVFRLRRIDNRTVGRDCSVATDRIRRREHRAIAETRVSYPTLPGSTVGPRRSAGEKRLQKTNDQTQSARAIHENIGSTGRDAERGFDHAHLE